MPLRTFFISSAFVFLFCLFACTQAVVAQDETYVQTFKDTMNLKFIVTNRGLTTTLQHNERGSMKLVPNTVSYLGFGGYIWGIGFQIHRAMPVQWFFDDEQASNSNIFDFQGTLFRNKWLLDGGYQSYQNLYVSNPEDFAGDGALMAGEEFNVRRLLGTVTHVFDGDRLSFKAAFNLNHRQLRTADSWLITAGYSSILLESEGPPPAQNTEQDLVSGMRGVSFLVRPGYAHHIVYRNFFLHTSAAAGLALQYQTYTKNDLEQSGWGVAPTYNLRGSLGYDNGRYFATLLAVFYHSSLKVEELHLQESSHNMQLMVGYRFAEPSWLTKAKPAFLMKLQ